MLKQYIAELNTNKGFEQALESNEDGSYSLRVEPDIDIVLREYPDGTITLHAKLAPLPVHQTEGFLCKAMEAHLFGRETGGACLGLDSQGKGVVLHKLLTEVHNYRLFHEHVEEFANYADAWRQETLEFTKNKG